MSTINEKTKDLLKMLGSSIVVAASAVWFLAHQIHSLSNEMNAMEKRIGSQISVLDKRITVIETVLIMQGYPIKNLAVQEQK